MKTASLSVTIAAAPRKVFNFVSDIANMPRWAANFCQGVRRDGDRWLVSTPNGEVETRVESDAETGIVDFYWRPAPQIELIAPSRVVRHGMGSEYIFTLFQAPGMSSDDFRAGTNGLREELNLLKQVLET